MDKSAPACPDCQEFRLARATMRMAGRAIRKFFRPATRGRSAYPGGNHRHRRGEASVAARLKPGSEAVDQAVGAALQWLRHLDEHATGARRGPHLDANALTGLRSIAARAGPTLPAARKVVAHLYGVEERTLRRLGSSSCVGIQLQQPSEEHMTNDDNETESAPASPAAPAPNEQATSNPAPRPDPGVYFTKSSPMEDVETR